MYPFQYFLYRYHEQTPIIQQIIAADTHQSIKPDKNILGLNWRKLEYKLTKALKISIFSHPVIWI